MRGSQHTKTAGKGWYLPCQRHIHPGPNQEQIQSLLIPTASSKLPVGSEQEQMLWFNPRQQLSTTQPLALSPWVGWGRESEE